MYDRNYKNKQNAEDIKLVTIKDVARLAGVSMTTVSRAFNEKAIIKAETRKNILAIADKIGYVPNFNARGLVTKKKFIIGVFFSSLHDGTSTSFFSAAIGSLYDALPDNYLLSINDIKRVNSFEQLVQNRVDGVLVVSQSDDDDEFIYQVKSSGIPLVVINRYISDREICNIASDDFAGLKDGVDYIASRGHKRIGMIEGIAGFTSSVQRRQGFDQSVISNNLTPVEAAIKIGDYSSKTGQEKMSEILALPKEQQPTCVVCGNDDTAIGALRACYLNGVKVPDDISLIGFDDIFYSSVSIPSLTTIRKPIGQMAGLGIKDLIAIINGEKVDIANRVKIQPQLVVRESVAKL